MCLGTLCSRLQPRFRYCNVRMRTKMLPTPSVDSRLRERFRCTRRVKPTKSAGTSRRRFSLRSSTSSRVIRLSSCGRTKKLFFDKFMTVRLLNEMVDMHRLSGASVSGSEESHRECRFLRTITASCWFFFFSSPRFSAWLLKSMVHSDRFRVTTCFQAAHTAGTTEKKLRSRLTVESWPNERMPSGSDESWFELTSSSIKPCRSPICDGRAVNRLSLTLSTFRFLIAHSSSGKRPSRFCDRSKCVKYASLPMSLGAVRRPLPANSSVERMERHDRSMVTSHRRFHDRSRASKPLSRDKNDSQFSGAL
mmetsp:Transcript_11236/g.28346  ORF Transcript_11236/g.28346 Transcript_11236/m.28346 type:complete len:307 (+) Transcript_11236:1890-2810(+)